MSIWKDIKKLFGIGEAVFHEKVDDAEERHAIAVSKKTLDDAVGELKGHQLALGTYDGLRMTLEQDVDAKVNELAALRAEANEFAAVIELGGDGAAEAREALALTLGEIAETEAELDDLNARLDEANNGYEEMFKEVQDIEEFLDGAADDIQDDEQKLAHARATRELAALRGKIAGGGDSALSKLKEVAEKRRTLINENAGQARTIRALGQDKKTALKERVRARIADTKADAAVDAFLASRKTVGAEEAASTEG